MKEIDVTGEKFVFLDCSEGNICFGSFSEEEKFCWKSLRSDLNVVDMKKGKES